LDLLARPAVGHRDRGRALAEAELDDRVASKGGVADVHPLAPEEFPELREPHAPAEEALDEGALDRAVGPAVAARPAHMALDPADDGGDQALIQRLRSRVSVELF
jgi:hypothetical protein